MNRYSATDRDNRNSDEMFGYLEDRIQALKQRISELEIDNEALRNTHGTFRPVSKTYSRPMTSSLLGLRN
jgi:hypothetical protein